MVSDQQHRQSNAGRRRRSSSLGASGAHGSGNSHEIHLSRHVTRDSMVENMLKSFNDMSHGHVSQYEESHDFQSSFRNGVFQPDPNHNYHNAVSPPLQPPGAPPRPRAAQGDAADLSRQDFFSASALPNHNPHPSAGPSARVLDNVDEAPAPHGAPPPNPASASHPSTATTTPTKSAPSSWKLRGHEKRPSRASTSSSVDSSSRPFRWTRSRSNSVDIELSRPQEPSRITTSILDRARPVPVEYHSFSDSPASSQDIRATASFSALQQRSAPPPINATASSAVRSALSPKNFSRKASATILGSPEQLRTGLMERQEGSQTHLRQQGAQLSSSTPVKERGGFFRRVFGSKGSANAASQENQVLGPPQLPPLEVGDHKSRGFYERTEQPPDATQSSSSAVPAAPEEPEAKEIPAQVLNKKTSFFRRRRKTVADKEPERTASQVEPVPSTPILSSNSLQKVIRPFLGDSPGVGVAPSTDRDTRASNAQGSNIYSFAPPVSHADERTVKTHRPRTASRVEASISSSTRPEQVPRPSTSARRPSHTPSTTDMRGSLVGGLDHLSLRSGSSRDMRSPIPHDSSFSSSRPSPLPPTAATVHDDIDDPTSPKTKPESRVLADLTNSSRQIKKGSLDNAPLIQEDSSKAVRTGSLPTLSSNRSIRAEHSAYVTSQDFVESPVVGSLYQSAAGLPLVQVEGRDAPEPTASVPDALEPTAADMEQAKQILEQQGDPLNQAKAAAVLNEPTPSGERVRRAYMGFYDFSGITIILALRDLCNHLALKGETQQVDRILSTFSQRWCDCNPSHGFKSVDVVHTICYSILLLNTDLHMADVESKMSRSQFVKNTVSTVRGVAEESAEGTLRNSTQATRAPIPWRDARSPSPSDGQSSERPSADLGPRGNRLSIRPSSGRPVSGVGSFTSPSPYDIRALESSSNLVNAPFDGTIKGWEAAVEVVLKDIYTSIRSDRLPLHGASETRLHQQTSAQSLSTTGSAMRRSGSLLSKTPSDPHLGRPQPSGQAGRWSSKNRSATRLYPPSSFTSSRTASRTSLEEQGMWSPTSSSTWSKSYYGQHTQTTMSSDSLSSRITQYDERYQQSIGFANALSHAIIREEGTSVGDDEDEANAQAAFEIEDGLELAGAPWAKEGMVKHKHHLETTDKKAKDRNWNECFAVVEKGWMRLFAFNSKSVRNAQKSRVGQKGAVVGGGNWTENAEAVGAFMLRQTIANALPPPGYSKQRPHVFALSLPNGAVHLFHVGTAEIAKEFVSSANYWSARLSKEPLMGGVSNVEYGWSDAVINMALIPDTTSLSGKRSATPTSSVRSPGAFHSRARSHSISASISTARPSISGSIRGSTDTNGTVAQKRMPADRINLSEWSPPQQSLMASHLPEVEQLEALRRYVQGVEDDLARHNELRGPMLLAFSPRGTNAARAMANWERKSSYLLREIVKFRTYIDSLMHAQTQKTQIAKEREEYENEKKKQRAIAAGKVKAPRGGSSGAVSLDLPAETIEAIRLAQMRAEQSAQGS